MDEERTDALIHEHNGLYVDFSRQNINETTMQVRASCWVHWAHAAAGTELVLMPSCCGCCCFHGHGPSLVHYLGWFN